MAEGAQAAQRNAESMDSGSHHGQGNADPSAIASVLSTPAHDNSASQNNDNAPLSFLDSRKQKILEWIQLLDKGGFWVIKAILVLMMGGFMDATPESVFWTAFPVIAIDAALWRALHPAFDDLRKEASDRDGATNRMPEALRILIEWVDAEWRTAFNWIRLSFDLVFFIMCCRWPNDNPSDSPDGWAKFFFITCSVVILLKEILVLGVPMFYDIRGSGTGRGWRGIVKVFWQGLEQLAVNPRTALKTNCEMIQGSVALLLPCIGVLIVPVLLYEAFWVSASVALATWDRAVGNPLSTLIFGCSATENGVRGTLFPRLQYFNAQYLWTIHSVVFGLVFGGAPIRVLPSPVRVFFVIIYLLHSLLQVAHYYSKKFPQNLPQNLPPMSTILTPAFMVMPAIADFMMVEKEVASNQSMFNDPATKAICSSSCYYKLPGLLFTQAGVALALGLLPFELYLFYFPAAALTYVLIAMATIVGYVVGMIARGFRRMLQDS